MKQLYKEKIISILEDIKSRSEFVGGGSGTAKRREFRDVNTIWNLGLTIKNALDDDSDITDEMKNGIVRKIVINFDYKILGPGNDWSSVAYDWLKNFQDKEYFLKICKYAGYREDKTKNRFRKGDMRYLIPIFTKISESSLSESKRNKLEKDLESDSILDLGAEEFLALTVKAKGKEYTPWSDIRESLKDILLKVDSITDKLESSNEREKFREELGESLISQISVALQLCVVKNESDYNYGYNLARKQEFYKKPKSQNKDFLNLLENLKLLLKDFKTKNRLLQKSDHYEIEQLASKLDAIKDENDFRDFFNRKKEISTVFG